VGAVPLARDRLRDSRVRRPRFEDVLICAIDTAAFALVKGPVGMTAHEWGQLGDIAVALVREADPRTLGGLTDL
jgi:hypothetical protein